MFVICAVKVATTASSSRPRSCGRLSSHRQPVFHIPERIENGGPVGVARLRERAPGAIAFSAREPLRRRHVQGADLQFQNRHRRGIVFEKLWMSRVHYEAPGGHDRASNSSVRFTVLRRC